MSKAVALTILQRLRRGFIRRSLWEDGGIKIFVNPCRNSSTRRDLTIWMTRTAGAGRLFPPGTALGEGPNLQYCPPEATPIFILIDGCGTGCLSLLVLTLRISSEASRKTTAPS